MAARGLEGRELIMSEQNKALSNRVFEEVWNQGKLDVIDELVAGNYVFNNPSVPGGKLTGPEAFKKFVQMGRAAVADIRITINDQVAEGDKVVTRWTETGTLTGALMGIAPTGKRGTMTGITIDRYQSGKLVEQWQNADQLGMFQQLGLVPMLAPAETSA
jgi:predicted ester cyclase